MKIKIETFTKKYPLTKKAVDGSVEKLIDSIFASPKNFELLETFFEMGYVHTTRQVGRGRWSNIDNRLYSIKSLLDLANIKYVVCNDAPKGGKCGNIVAIAEGWVGIVENGETRYHSVQQGINTNSISERVFKNFGVEEQLSL